MDHGVYLMENEKVYQMDFAKIYHLLVSKAEKKGRTRQEVDEVIRWLTGYAQAELEAMTEKQLSYGDFFRNAPSPNENRKLIKGVVCGVRAFEIHIDIGHQRFRRRSLLPVGAAFLFLHGVHYGVGVIDGTASGEIVSVIPLPDLIKIHPVFSA